jgi:hypothetical protein
MNVRAGTLMIWVSALFLSSCVGKCWTKPLSEAQIADIRGVQSGAPAGYLSDRDAAMYVATCFPFDPVTGERIFYPCPSGFLTGLCRK